MNLTAAIIDDEEKGRQSIANQIKRYCPQVEVIFEASGVEDALQKLSLDSPKVIFLDINMTDGTGFDLLNKLGSDLKSWIIFTTAYEEYAIKAFRYSAIDYLLKPIEPDLLIEAVNKVETFAHKQHLPEKLEVYNENKNELKTILQQTNQELKHIDINQLIRCEASSNYTVFYVEKSDKIVISKSLGEFEDLLEDTIFVRIHKSHIVNVKKIKSVDWPNLNVTLQDGTMLDIARRRKDALMDAFKK